MSTDARDPLTITSTAGPLPRNAPTVAAEPLYRVTPQLVGRRLVPLTAARVLDMRDTSCAFTFGHRGVEYFACQTGHLYRVAREDETPDAIYPYAEVGRPKEGVPLVEVEIVDADFLTIDQMAASNQQLARYEARRDAKR